MKGKIDFIVCEEEGAWYIESLQVPKEIATQPNPVLVDWAKEEKFNDSPGIVFVGVYWRDTVIDDIGLTKDALVSQAYKNMSENVRN